MSAAPITTTTQVSFKVPSEATCDGAPMSRDLHRRSALTAVAVCCCAALAAGCGASGSAQVATGPKVPKHFTVSRVDPSRFGPPTPAANRWLPLTAGTQWVRVGTTDVGHRSIPHRVISTVTNVTKQIAGVSTVAVLDQDVDAGQVAQQSIDYLAQDKEHRVWDMGGYTEEYEGGRLTAVRDAWLAGVRGGKAGILMPADPRGSTPPWTIARPPGADPDAAEVVRTGQSQCVPFRCFKDVLVIREGKASALDNEFKYYAAGVGEILNTPKSASAHNDVERLVNVTTLSPRGLLEISRETLKLDRHAGSKKPAVFGRAAPARSMG